MSEKWQEEAARLLPCVFKGGITKDECPTKEISMICSSCSARPAVAAALAAATLEDYNMGMHAAADALTERDNEIAQLRAEVAKLKQSEQEQAQDILDLCQLNKELTAEREELQRIIYTGNAAIQRQIELTTRELEAERDASAEKFGCVVAALRKDIAAAVVHGLEISEDTARHFRTDIDFTGIANIHAATCELIANAIAAEIAKRTTKGENK